MLKENIDYNHSENHPLIGWKKVISLPDGIIDSLPVLKNQGAQITICINYKFERETKLKKNQ